MKTMDMASFRGMISTFFIHKLNINDACTKISMFNERQVSFALRAYGSLATSADKGAVRDKSKLGG